MKHMLFVLMIAFSIVGKSQTIPEPDFSGKPMIYRDGKFISLEKNESAVDYKSKGFGYGGMETFYNCFPEKSECRIKNDSTFKIVIKVDAGQDPIDLFTICKAETNKKKRSFKVGKMGMTGKAKELKDNFIKFEIKKLGQSYYQLILPKDISAGEYAFIPSTNKNDKTSYTLNPKVVIYCFAID